MEQNNFLSVSDEPMAYLHFKKEYIPYLVEYHNLNYSFEYSEQLNKIFKNSPYKNGALQIFKNEITITFSSVVDRRIVLNDYVIDLFEFKMFLEMEYIEVREELSNI